MPASSTDEDAIWQTGVEDPWFSNESNIVAQIPIIGDGERARRAGEEQRADERRALEMWRDLGATAPSVDDLTSDYYAENTGDEYGDMAGGPSALEGYGSSGDQRAAQQALMNLYTSGGYTAQDTAAREQMRRVSAGQRGQQLRGANEAALQQAYARGQGGGGAELASRLSGSQAMIQGQAMGDSASEAAFQQAAQARALQGLMGYQSGANTMQGQELGRRQALDSYNQQNLDWRRGRETRNTGWANRSEDSRTAAEQQAYNNRRETVAGATGQYNNQVANSNNILNAQNQASQGQAAAAGGLFSFLADL